MKGQGGSYLRQADGSLKLVSQTAPPEPKAASAIAAADAVAEAPAAETKPLKPKKEVQNG